MSSGNYGPPGNRFGNKHAGNRYSPGNPFGRKFVPPRRRPTNKPGGNSMRPPGTFGSRNDSGNPMQPIRGTTFGPQRKHKNPIPASEYHRLSQLNPFGGSEIAADDPARAALGNRRVFMASQRIKDPDRLRKRLKFLMQRRQGGGQPDQ